MERLPPRLRSTPGLAWDITGKGTTVVRGGFSIIYSTFVLESFLGQFALQNSGSTSPPPSDGSHASQHRVCFRCGSRYLHTHRDHRRHDWPSNCIFHALAAQLGLQAWPKRRHGFTDRHRDMRRRHWLGPKPVQHHGCRPESARPYIVNWNFGIQHAFTNNLSLEVGYVGNHGSRLFGIRDIIRRRWARGGVRIPR